MKPMIKYRGGKSKEIPHIMEHVPNFNGRYIEPFLGGGAVFFHLEPEQAIINDINAPLMAFYRGVRDDYQNLRQELDGIEAIYSENRVAFDALKAQHPDERVEDHNEELYYEIRNMYNNLVERRYSDALLYYFINKTAYSGMIRYNARGEFNVPFGRYKNINTRLITEQHSELLQRAELFNTDYSDIFNMSQQGDFMFLDPPYDCIFSDYGNEEYRDGFNEENHRRLAQDFRNLGCMAMMVIGRTPLTEELYNGMIIDDYGKQYAVNIRNRFKSAANHIVVTNY
jgi:DNA adenine methylase